MRRIRIGTRPSLLALAQCQHVADLLYKNDHIDSDFSLYRTSGDRAQGTSTAGQLSKMAWVDDLESALINNEVDMLVHSSKDVSDEIRDGTVTTSISFRSSPADCLLMSEYSQKPLKEVIEGYIIRTRIGTASYRRKAELLRLNSTLDVIEHRGNVPTRIQKFEENDQIKAIVLAHAGLLRLNVRGLFKLEFTPDEMMPAPGQGTLCIQYRSDDAVIKNLISSYVDKHTQAAWLAERYMVEKLNIDCKSAVGIFAYAGDDELCLRYRALKLDGSDFIEGRLKGNLNEPEKVGELACNDAVAKKIDNFLTR